MNISFSSEEAFERYKKCSETTAHLTNSLDACIQRLVAWHPWNHTIKISCDFDELSFYFQEYNENDEARGMNGGIIFHGDRDGFGSGNDPTFSVCVTPTSGYSIHT